jgi:hypothetical protein
MLGKGVNHDGLTKREIRRDIIAGNKTSSKKLEVHEV